MVFQCINIRQFLREVLKTVAFGHAFQNLLGTWRMLMHEKTCLIPILVEVGLLTRKITTSRSRQMVVSCRQANPKALSDLSSPTTIVSQYNAARCSETNRTETNNLHRIKVNMRRIISIDTRHLLGGLLTIELKLHTS